MVEDKELLLLADIPVVVFDKLLLFGHVPLSLLHCCEPHSVVAVGFNNHIVDWHIVVLVGFDEN